MVSLGRAVVKPGEWLRRAFAYNTASEQIHIAGYQHTQHCGILLIFDIPLQWKIPNID